MNRTDGQQGLKTSEEKIVLVLEPDELKLILALLNSAPIAGKANMERALRVISKVEMLLNNER